MKKMILIGLLILNCNMCFAAKTVAETVKTDQIDLDEFENLNINRDKAELRKAYTNVKQDFKRIKEILKSLDNNVKEIEENNVYLNDATVGQITRIENTKIKINEIKKLLK
jgi:hypothetical protein